MTEPRPPGVMLALKPRFAQAILDGTKDVELRRQPVSVRPGSAVLLYSSSPVCAAVGWATVEEVLSGALDELWSTHGSRTSLVHREYADYYCGVTTAHALVLHSVRRLKRPVSLHELRSAHKTEAPQSWRFLPTSLRPEM